MCSNKCSGHELIIYLQPLDFMASLCKYWFRFSIAPPKIQERIREMQELYEYQPRTDSNGEPIVSEMFLMHCEAATVREAS